MVLETIFWSAVVLVPLHILVLRPPCLPSGVLAKWMLCLQHVLVLSSGVCVRTCVCVCTRPPVWFSTATLAAAFGEVCVCVVPVQRTSWAFRDCACVCIDGESSSRILLLHGETHCFDWADKLARSPQSAISFFFFPLPPVSTLSLSSILTPSPPPPPPSFSASLCALRTAGQGDSDEVHISVNQNVDQYPLQAGTHINTDTHIHTQIHSPSLPTSPSSVYVSVFIPVKGIRRRSIMC